ncbi:MAG: hypothetical protein EAZ47_10815 [Bacteroidetes bacterium]|nr:MAG: hypothetical protein EAY72_06440 [Bacteroidota bacterium]TAF90734.1 MAG: hypothetical protein EAZ47_10815 [Bacteroidota bacterium]
MRYLYTLVLALGSSLLLHAQTNNTKEANKTFFAEFGGPGILFSANFDQRFKSKERLGFGYRAGLGFTLVDETEFTNNMFFTTRTNTVITVPLGVNYLFGRPNSPNMFEVGVGGTILSRPSSILNYNDYTQGNLTGNATFMYRRQPVDGGFSFRIGFVPTINTDGDIFPFAAVGLGYSFR